MVKIPYHPWYFSLNIPDVDSQPVCNWDSRCDFQKAGADQREQIQTSKKKKWIFSSTSWDSTSAGEPGGDETNSEMRL